MNILTISGSAWDDRNSVGNTYSNLLGEMDDVKLYNIYCREAAPYNKYCKEYYTVTATDLIKNLFHRSRIGRRFSYEFEEQPPQKQENAIERTNAFLKGWIRNIGLLTLDCLYNNSWWQNDKFKAFIAEANPDIVFCFGIADSYRYQILKYVKKKTSAKIVTFFVDDTVFSAKDSISLLSTIKYKRFKSIVGMSDRVYGITQEMCDSYKTEFGRDFEVLQKGCEITKPKISVNTPVEIVYAGNLLYGRDDVLAKFAECIEHCNKDGLKAVLKIYTGTKVTGTLATMLNRGASSQICGSVPYHEVKRVMKHADIVLHVESFEPQNMKKVRFSFSTKITDCLQSGNAMLVVGPRGIAPVEEPRSMDGSVVIDDINKLQTKLSELLDNPEVLVSNAAKLHKVAEERFAQNKVTTRLYNDFVSLIR